MSEISIQVRRVTERVKQYYSIFGLRPFARMAPGRSVIRGSKRLGFDEIECVVAETARGTSVGFYAINQLQGLLHSIPFLFMLLLTGLAQVKQVQDYILGSADNFISINFQKLFLGEAQMSFWLIFILILIPIIFFLTDYLVQRIRVDIIKSRFSFYSRDAIWETREVPLSMITLQAIRSTFMHLWALAIVYFAVFSSTGKVVTELSSIYQADTEALYSATIDAFVITGGLVLGLLTSYKSLKLRKQYGRVDNRIRISGGLTERRFDPILFGSQAAILAGLLVSAFFSFTFFASATTAQIGQFMIFVVIGGAIAGAIQEEGETWILSSYGIFIFFTSLLLIFRTGQQPAYAYVVVLQLFLVPIPFIMLLSTNYEKVLKKADITNPDWLFDTIPFLSFLSLFLASRKQELARRAYEKNLEEEISTEALPSQIKITKSLLQNTDSNAYRLVRHYFELLFTYTASYEETQFVTLPTYNQFQQWWTSRTGSKPDDQQEIFFNEADQLLWDPDYQPEDTKLAELEDVGKKMVLKIQ